MNQRVIFSFLLTHSCKLFSEGLCHSVLSLDIGCQLILTRVMPIDNSSKNIRQDQFHQIFASTGYYHFIKSFILLFHKLKFSDLDLEDKYNYIYIYITI